MDKTQKEKIREIMTDFDIKQRLFLNGKYHSTQFNKWFEQTLKDVADLAIKETEERIASSIRMAECSHDSNSHCMEEMCWIHQEGGYNEAVRDIINLIRNK